VHILCKVTIYRLLRMSIYRLLRMSIYRLLLRLTHVADPNTLEITKRELQSSQAAAFCRLPRGPARRGEESRHLPQGAFPTV
jgi:hypothetical protein